MERSLRFSSPRPAAFIGSILIKRALPVTDFFTSKIDQGLLLTLRLSSYTSVAIMVEPQRILVEEIKVVSAKVKVTDLVVVRHMVNTGQKKSEQRTTLIVVCDDGFSVEVTNSDTSSVIVGVRILVGSQDVQSPGANRNNGWPL